MSTAPLSPAARALHFLFPFLSWLKTYDLPSLKIDATAGVTVAMVLIPQSMANAQLAGLPAYHGLYAALFPALVGGLWGSSRQMVTGTVAVVSLMAGAALQPLAIGSAAGYAAYMALLTLLVGAVQLLFGVFRLGMVVNFLSLPVIAGFTNASAIIIASSQLGKLFGVTVDSAPRQAETVLRVLSSAWNYTHMPSVVMAAFTVALLWGCKKYAPKLPAALVAVIVTTFFSWALNFEHKTVVPLSAIQSDEARVLLTRLSRQEAELAAIAATTRELEAKTPETTAEGLDRDFALQEQSLLEQRIRQNMRLMREHLREMLFVAETKEDGTLIFYDKQSPGLVPVASSSQQPPRPADAFADGNTWRLLMGSSSPHLDKLRFSSGGEIVGDIPASLPYFSMPSFSFANLLQLLPSALVIAFMGFAESVTIGKNAANLRGYRLDANQELVGQGLANLVGGVTMTSPVSGSFSSSAVNLAAGARTGLSSVFVSLVTLLSLLFFTGALRYVPQPVLAVIILRAVGGLLHFGEFKRVWTAQWYDGCIACITFFATLYFAPHLDYGIGIGIILSLGTFFYRAMTPTVVALSVDRDHMLRDAKAFKLEECRHIAIVNFQGPLFFASAGVLENHILERLENQKDLRHIHLVCSGITQMDASGEDSLAMLVARAQRQGVGISLSGVVGSVALVLGRTGVLDAVGLDNIFLTPREAICAIHTKIQHDAACASCPLSHIFCRPLETDMFDTERTLV